MSSDATSPTSYTELLPLGLPAGSLPGSPPSKRLIQVGVTILGHCVNVMNLVANVLKSFDEVQSVISNLIL